MDDCGDNSDEEECGERKPHQHGSNDASSGISVKVQRLFIHQIKCRRLKAPLMQPSLFRSVRMIIGVGRKRSTNNEAVSA